MDLKKKMEIVERFGEEIQRLQDEGRWTEAEYDRVFREYAEALGPGADLEPIYQQRPRPAPEQTRPGDIQIGPNTWLSDYDDPEAETVELTVENTMRIFGVDRDEAETMLARNHRYIGCLADSRGDPNEPDWATLYAIGDEVQRLRDEGRWTPAEFDRLYEEARKATNGHTRFLEFLIRQEPKR